MDHLSVGGEESVRSRVDMKQEEEENEKKQKDVCEKRQGWTPCFFRRPDREKYFYVGHDIIVQEALDSYAGMIWPAALALCQYLESNQQQVSVQDKAVLEIGAGTGLLSIVASLLGAWVTATDLPEVLGNLRFNLSKNTRGRCRHTPQVAPLSWGYDLERSYPTSVYRYDYILAADVVYHHDFLDQLLATMKHFCQPGTTLIWANKVRVESDLVFMDKFQKAFQTKVLVEDGEMKIFMATCGGLGGEGPARGGRRLP
ncbi:protein-lysine methyltransferase METTL21C [Nerophis lumbriciformis]|uniref:protein-lysine methyltransferase METTL21C n=1 Tax=Nerophis lumbriciformis TaxID=546530 RepID=UPI003BAB8FE0